MGRSYINKETGEHIELVPICPKCRAAIYWISCDWEGIVMRMEDNDVSIYNDKMRLVPYKIVRKQRRKP